MTRQHRDATRLMPVDRCPTDSPTKCVVVCAKRLERERKLHEADEWNFRERRPFDGLKMDHACERRPLDGADVGQMVNPGSWLEPIILCR